MAASSYYTGIYNGAAAYDLYGNTAVRQRSEKESLPQERTSARARHKEPALSLSAVFCIVAAFCSLFVILFSYVRTYEANTRYSELMQDLSALQEERDQLLNRYDSMLDLQAIEAVATEQLGMTKPFGGQTVYVNLSGTDRGEVIDAKVSPIEETVEMFREAFAELGAYLSK